MPNNQKSHQKEQSQQTVKKGKTVQEAKPDLKLAQMLDAPETLHQADVLNAQQQLGNQVVQRALDRNQRRDSLTDDQGNLQKEISDEIHKERGGGSPLPDHVHKEVGKRFKRDFDDVRLHTDEKADSLSRTINARAFTIGKDIFFKKGVFEPGSSEGRETLHHELTHVVQQSGGKGTASQLKLGGNDTAQEQEADRVGKQNSNAPITGTTSSGSAVQTIEEEDELQMQEDGPRKKSCKCKKKMTMILASVHCIGETELMMQER